MSVPASPSQGRQFSLSAIRAEEELLLNFAGRGDGILELVAEPLARKDG